MRSAGNQNYAVGTMTVELEKLLSEFRRQNTCCKSVTIRLETICITGEQNCIQRISSFFTSHGMQPRRTPSGLEFSTEDLVRAVEIYDQVGE
jgi:hypothetical protein